MWMTGTRPLAQSVNTNDLLHELVNATQTTQALMVGFLALLVLLAIVAILGWSLRRGAKKDADDGRTLADVINVVATMQTQQGELLKQNAESLRMLKEQTELNVQRNLTQLKQQASLESIAATNNQTMKFAEQMTAVVGNIDSVKNAAIKDINDHTTEAQAEVTDAMNTAFARVFEQIAEIRTMVEALGKKSTTDHNTLVSDVREIITRLDSIQHVADTLPSTGSLEGKAATGTDAQKPPTPASSTPEPKKEP